MTTSRRNLLLGAPAALLGIEQLQDLASAQSGGAAVAGDVTDFWVRGMGVPAHLVLGGANMNARGATQLDGADFGREPLFLHYDSDEQSLVVAEEIHPQRLAPSGDARVDFRMLRLRLNPEDDRHFRNYTTGGIYLDFQQQQPDVQTAPLSDSLLTLASSVFSAIFPGPKSNRSDSNGNGETTGKKPSGGGGAKSGNKSRGRSAASGSADGAPPPVGSSVPLQQPRQSQSLALPGGLGKTSFACFAKDRKKTLFGQFVDAIATSGGAGADSYLSLLPLTAIATSALTAVKALVANLQAHGGNQEWIMRSSPVDVAATAEACSTLSSAIRLRSGFYIAVPKSQAATLKNHLKDLKIMDGFLVPKDTSRLDLAEAAPQTLPQITYISLDIRVAKGKNAASGA